MRPVGAAGRIYDSDLKKARAFCIPKRGRKTHGFREQLSIHHPAQGRLASNCAKRQRIPTMVFHHSACGRKGNTRGRGELPAKSRLLVQARRAIALHGEGQLVPVRDGKNVPRPRVWR